MFNARLKYAIWFALFLTAGRATAAEQPAPPKGDKTSNRFLRLTRDKDKSPLALETAIVRFTPVDGKRRIPSVDLVAAVHIGDKSYYEQLNREFESYDAGRELLKEVGTLLEQNDPYSHPRTTDTRSTSSPRSRQLNRSRSSCVSMSSN